ncbi:MAG: NADH-ubiquinone oxidoreductase-F iron-sulfur binding region domain-containing protein [Lacunisphaera sp.]|nr:NADH-ubiquinone oxidoreductase-F iron-sulfur binding region domain-containing protein [Lacunisphaera sp.]
MTLNDLQETKAKELATRKKIVLRCCLAAGCISSDAKGVKEQLVKAVAEAGLQDEVEVRGVGCMKLCCEGPLVQADPSNALYIKVTPDNAPAIIAALKGGKVALQQADPNSPFFTKQEPIVLANCGLIDPERIESYIAADGYLALHDAIVEMEPKDVLDAMVKSGLRGRGGAGFPTGLKWGTVAKSPGARKYVICNADEGDPGAFMDRSVLESDPHAILEGMVIAGYAVGADQGYIYCRAEYPLAITRLQKAIHQAKRLGLLGAGIFESPINFNIDIRIGAGAFVCGEETALMASVEGKRGTPRPRPPFPAERGLFDCPTLINNVETFANVAPILRRGVEWFAGIGTEKSKGTKVFALAGKIQNTGLIEVPMGTPLRTIVEEMGGGAPDGGKIKAVQTGGPSGGCIPAQHLDTPVDYESLTQLGSIMGSGGMIVMDETTRMVDVARFFMEFCMDESCGKCIPCRAGTVQMHHLLVKLLAREANARDLAQLEELCDMVKNTSLCGLGQTSPNPVLSTLRFFREEYEELLQPDPHAVPQLAAKP